MSKKLLLIIAILGVLTLAICAVNLFSHFRLPNFQTTTTTPVSATKTEETSVSPIAQVQLINSDIQTATVQLLATDYNSFTEQLQKLLAQYQSLQQPETAKENTKETLNYPIFDQSIAQLQSFAELCMQKGQQQSLYQTQAEEALKQLKAVQQRITNQHTQALDRQRAAIKQVPVPPEAVSLRLNRVLAQAYQEQAQVWQELNKQHKQLVDNWENYQQKEQILLAVLKLSVPALREAAYAMQMQEQPEFNQELLNVLKDIENLAVDTQTQQTQAKQLQAQTTQRLLFIGRSLN